MAAGYSLFLDLFRDYFAVTDASLPHPHWPGREGVPMAVADPTGARSLGESESKLSHSKGVTDDVGARGERLAASLQQLAAQGALPPERVPEILPLLAHLLSARCENGAQLSPYVSPEERRHQTFLAVQAFFLALARLQPLVLVLEDLHWADRLSLDLLSLLMEALPQAPLLLLCVYRPEPEHRSWHLGSLASRKCPERYTEIHLGELSPAESRELLARLLPGERLAEGVKERVLVQAQGNPFFLEEVVRSLMEAEAIAREDGGDPVDYGFWILDFGLGRQRHPTVRASHSARQSKIQNPKSKIEKAVAPSTGVQSVIQSRVDRLAPEEKALLQEAAVIGPRFRRSLLEKLVGSGQWMVDSEGPSPPSPSPALSTTHYSLSTALWELEERGLIYQERATPEEEYVFRHALTQATIYHSIAPERRALLHERVGRALEGMYAGAVEEYLEELAHHFGQARSGPGAEKGVEYCLRAGEKARDLYANEAAIRHLTAALALLDGLAEDEPHLRQRWEVVSHLARAYSDCRTFERAEEAVQEYLALAQRAGYPWGVAAAHYWMGEVLGWAHAAAGVAGWESSRRLRERHLEESVRIAQQHGLTDWQARARVRLARHLASVKTDLPRAEALLREALQALEGLPRAEAQEIFERLAWVCALQEKWDAVKAAVRQSIPFGGVGMLFCLGTMEEALIRAGKPAAFVNFCEEVKALYARAGVSRPFDKPYLQPAAPSKTLLARRSAGLKGLPRAAPRGEPSSAPSPD